MNKKPVCMCCAVKIKQNTQRLFDEFSYFFFLDYIYKYKYFVLSNSVKCNLCKFSVAYIAGYKSTMYYSLKLIFFLFKAKSCFSILLFCYLLPTIKLTKHYMFSAASIESVCLNWMLSFALFVFIVAFYL